MDKKTLILIAVLIGVIAALAYAYFAPKLNWTLPNIDLGGIGTWINNTIQGFTDFVKAYPWVTTLLGILGTAAVTGITAWLKERATAKAAQLAQQTAQTAALNVSTQANTVIADLQKQVTDATNQLKSYQEQNLSGMYTEAKSTIDGLTSQLSTAQRSYADLQTQFEALQKQLLYTQATVIEKTVVK